MCRAFSCIATRTKVYWKCGLDSHNDIKEHFKLKDDNENYIPIEIIPNNKDYINPDKWIFKFDDKCPDWWKQSHEQRCWDALDNWKKEVYSKIYKNRINNLINPFKLPMVKQPTKTDINNLRKWDSVGNSVGNSIRDSVCDSVGNSIRDSVWNSVGNSIGDSVRYSVWKSVGNSIGDSVGDSERESVRYSVWDSIWAYIGYMFKLNRQAWKYTSKIKCKGYPFTPLIELWTHGLVPSFDGAFWRLHSGTKAKIVFKINKNDLKESLGAKNERNKKGD